MFYKNKITGNTVDAFKFTDADDNYPQFFTDGINNGTILIEYREEDHSKFCELEEYNIMVNANADYIIRYDFGITAMGISDFERQFELVE